MKSTIIRNVMTVLLALFSLHVSAQTFSYNGLKYELDGNTATVIKYYNSSGFVINITIPSSIEYGGKQYSVTSISPDAFRNCSGLTSVTIPNSVTSIGRYAFSGCSGLASVTIPNSVTSIGESAFKGCSGLTSAILDNNWIVSGCSIGTLFGSQIKECIIGNSATSIGASVFANCNALTSVTIPNSVTSIGNQAFSGCI